MLGPHVPVQRQEKTRPGERIHLDIEQVGRVNGIGHRTTWQRTGYRRTHGIGWEIVHARIDDLTRLSQVEVPEIELGITAEAFLQRAEAWYSAQGVTVGRAMTDSGSCCRSKNLSAAVAGLGSKHSKTRPFTARTKGKHERFILRNIS